MAFGFGFGLPRGGNTIWSPASLFAQNEPGVWYDPSDMATLFQDAAGTTPVTAVEQPVGLMLDKSRGLVLGSELVTNGDFSNGTTGWSVNAGATLSVTDGVIRVTTVSGGVAYVTQSFATIVGKTYRVDGTIVAVGPAFTAVRKADNNTSSVNVVNIRETLGAGSGVFIATATTTFIILQSNTGGAGQFAEFDNISVRELPGVHATSLTTSRPVLTARVNLLTKTEQFDDAAWAKTDVNITANSTVSPDGTANADGIIENTANSLHRVRQFLTITNGTACAVSVYAKAIGSRRLYTNVIALAGAGALFDLTGNGTVVNVAGTAANRAGLIEAVGNDWYRCTVIGTGTGVASVALFQINQSSSTIAVDETYTGDGTSGIYLWGASLTTTDQASLGYQRVNTATDYDTVGFPMWLKADGVDDYMVTGTLAAPVNLNMSTTDKVTVATGVRKLSDAAAGFVCELSANSTTSTGTFTTQAPSSVPNTYRFASWGNGASRSDATSAASYAAPITNVLTGIGDISGDLATLRINGAQVAQSTADQGTGNFGNYPLYLFRRGGTTLPFNGLSAGLTVVGRTLTAAELSQLETYYQQKTKAY